MWWFGEYLDARFDRGARRIRTKTYAKPISLSTLAVPLLPGPCVPGLQRGYQGGLSVFNNDATL